MAKLRPMTPKRTREFYPSPAEEQLLTALVSPRHARHRAIIGWLQASDISAMNEGMKRLLPLAYQSLQAGGDAAKALAPALQRDLQRYYRKFWAETQQIHYEAEQLSNILAIGNAPRILLKGMALGKFAYASPVLRPCSDIDVLVPQNVFQEAQQKLLADGYSRSGWAFHSMTFCKPGHADVDLHLSPHHAAFHERFADPLFSRLAPLPGSAYFRLSHEDQLLHTFSHGIQRNAVAPIRWMLDAVLLLRHAGPSFDWDLFCSEAARLEIEDVALLGVDIVSRIAPALLESAPAAALAQRLTAMKAFWFMAERQWTGPFFVWARARRNFSLRGRLRVFRDHYTSAFVRRVNASRGLET